MGSFGPNKSPLTTDASIDTMLFWAAIGLAFLYFCFSVSVAFPIYFRFGFSKAYIFTMLPLYLVVLATLLITRKLNLTLGVNGTLRCLNDHAYLLPIIGVAAGLIVVAISIPITRSIYEHKEI
jgi:hypothetical protein